METLPLNLPEALLRITLPAYTSHLDVALIER
jgi:hypothetical protein